MHFLLVFLAHPQYHWGQGPTRLCTGALGRIWMGGKGAPGAAVQSTGGAGGVSFMNFIRFEVELRISCQISLIFNFMILLYDL